MKWRLKGSKLKLILTSRTQETPLCNSTLSLKTSIWQQHLLLRTSFQKTQFKKPSLENGCKNPSLQKLPFENLYSLTFHFGNNSCSWKQKCFQKSPFSNTRLFSKANLSYQKPLHTHITPVKCLKTRAFSWKFQLHAKTRHGTKLVLWPILVQNPIWPTILFYFLHPSTLLQVSSPNKPN